MLTVGASNTHDIPHAQMCIGTSDTKPTYEITLEDDGRPLSQVSFAGASFHIHGADTAEASQRARLAPSSAILRGDCAAAVLCVRARGLGSMLRGVG